MSFESPRRKAFLGVALGVASLASSVIGGISARKQAREAAEMEKRRMELEDLQTANANASRYGQAMANVMNNQQYVDEMKQRVVFRNGGRRKFTLGSNVPPPAQPATPATTASSALGSAGTFVDLGFNVLNLLSPIKRPQPRMAVQQQEYSFQPKESITKGVDDLHNPTTIPQGSVTDELPATPTHLGRGTIKLLKRFGGRKHFCG